MQLQCGCDPQHHHHVPLRVQRQRRGVQAVLHPVAAVGIYVIPVFGACLRRWRRASLCIVGLKSLLARISGGVRKGPSAPRLLWRGHVGAQFLRGGLGGRCACAVCCALAIARVAPCFPQVPNGQPINPSASVTVSEFKPSTLAAAPSAVSVLTPGGPVPVPFTLNETGMVLSLGNVLQPSPVLLGTYFRNYSVADVCMVHAARNPGWPQVWGW
jgi:hypothetical protein